jgi:hypothetical protein
MRNELLEYATGERSRTLCRTLCLEGRGMKKKWITLIRLRFGTNFEVNVGMAEMQACSATWVSDNDSEFPVGPRKTTGTLIDLAG